MRRGNLACFNAFGSGLGDDKLVHAYAEDMVRFYLGEEPIVGSVPTYDLGDPEQLELALERLGELVVKPRTGYGGFGVVIVPHASRRGSQRGRARDPRDAEPLHRAGDDRALEAPDRLPGAARATARRSPPLCRHRRR